MNVAVACGISAATARHAETVLVLPGDIPLVTAEDFDALLRAADGDRAVAIGASRDGQGTNALLLRPPDVIRPAFGPPSVERHVGLALAADASPRVVADLGLSVDVDTPGDLAMLADLPVGKHTAEWLASNALPRRLASAT
jgi:2-phospho-L-lactate guanylyltransferase